MSLLPIFSAIRLMFPFPLLDAFARYIYFDTEGGASRARALHSLTIDDIRRVEFNFENGPKGLRAPSVKTL